MGQEILTGRELIQKAEKLGVFTQDLEGAAGSINEVELRKRVDKAGRDLRDRIWLVAVTFIMIWIMIAFTAWTAVVEKIEKKMDSITAQSTANEDSSGTNSESTP